MLVAVSASGNTMDSTVDPRFGRCDQFIIVNTDTMKYRLLKNSATSLGHGAGINAAQTIINKDIDVVISGSIGPNAYQTLSAANIKLYQATGTIKEVIEKLKNNDLTPITGPLNRGHMGMGRSGGMGRGRRR
jgi:predicted Fe-Mo cluster-binding NifX family protein